MYYCNVNGFQTKKESIRKIIEDLNPKVVVLCETKLQAGNTIKSVLSDYEVCTRPTKIGKSGLAIAVKLQTFASVLDVTTTPHGDILTVRISMANKSVRIILGYAPQENDDAELRESFFTELSIEVTNCLIANDLPIIVGDLNAKIQKYNGQISPITRNGKLLADMVQSHQLEVLNFHEKCSGKWTHVTRTTGATSTLDYVITSSEVTKCVEKMIIDEECLLCPFRIIKNRGKSEPKYSDHNAIITEFQIEHQRRVATSHKKWRITTEGLDEFHRLTTEDLDMNLSGKDIQEKYDDLERKINVVMDKCFKKVKSKQPTQISTQYMTKYKQITSFARRGKCQRKVAKIYIQELMKINVEAVAEREKEKVKYILTKLTIDDKFSPNNFWELCKKSRRHGDSGTSIENSDGSELFGIDLVSNAYLEEFVHRLRKREIVPELKNYEQRTEQICQLYLEEARNNKEPMYTQEEYDKVCKGLKKGKSCGRDLFPPDVFIRGGEQLHTSILSMLNLIKSSDVTIHQWTLVLIATIYKNKGSRKQLVNHRGIFLKQILAKMFEKLNMNRIQDKLKLIDKFQAGNQSNRSPADQTFLLRAAVDHCKYTKKCLYIVLYDYKQCFDSLWLSDCLLSLWKLGVNSETLNNLRNLNETCNMVVKSPVGITKEAKVTSIVQQGSVSGGVLCSASTAEVTQENLGRGCQIGTTSVKALIFVDDIATTNTEVSDTYQSHDNIVWFSKRKRIPLNIPKCMGLCVNQKKTDIIPRLKIDEQIIKWTNVAVYLGDHFNASGNNRELVEDRVKKGKACIVTAMSLCSETTMGVYTIQTLMLLYKSLFLPVVLYNSQAWSNMTKHDISLLNTIQLKFLKRIFHVPPSTSNPITFLETGSLPIEQEINIRRLNFLHHVLSLDTSDPVKKVYEEQLKLSHEGNWANEMKNLRTRYNIVVEDDEVSRWSKEGWKKMVKSKIREFALKLLNAEMAEQKHGRQLPRYTQLTPQSYLTELQPSKARKMFHVRAGVLDLKTIRKYWYSDSTCRLCEQGDETVDHVVNICGSVPRSSTIDNLYTNSVKQMELVAERCLLFAEMVKERECDIDN